MIHDITPAEYLARLAAGEGPHDVANAALMFSALDHPHLSLAPYHAHLADIADAAKSLGAFASDAGEAAKSLSDILAGRFGYDGDRMQYRDPRNTDLIAVIDRRRGLPVTLGVLYMHAARAAGFKAQGLLAPGHFLLAVSVNRSEAVIDPFNAGAVDRDRMAGLPLVVGAIDEAGTFDAVSDTDVLLRLQNNAKLRALEANNPERATEILRRMCWIAPSRAGLWLELGRQEESSGALGAARRAFESALSRTEPGSGIYNETALALHALKCRLN